MGMFKDAKAAGLGNEASKALEDGAMVFTPRLNFPATMHGLSGNVSDTKGRPEAYPVFRRR